MSRRESSTKKQNVHIKETIHELEERKIQLGIELENTKAAIDVLSHLSSDSPGITDARVIVPPLTERPPKRKHKKRKKTKSPTEHIAGLRGPRNQFSQYKGVTKGPARKDGSFGYKACFWNGKKNITVGTFDNEMDAAAAIEQHKAKIAGQAEDTQARIRNRIEQHENEKMKKWKCAHCGLVIKQTDQPGECLICHSASFKEIE